jgi:adenine/guanine phosphoribosyltransferase-like PRPP-binding protein
MDEHTLYAARDPQGIRPLSPRPAGSRLGRRQSRPRRWTSSAPLSCATSSRGSSSRSTRTGCARRCSPSRSPKGCVFEYVYLARPDTTINGRSRPRSAQRGDGRKARDREHPVEADIVIPVPESGTPAAIGYAQESGMPFGQGLVKNAYVGRTFIQPSQTIRQLGIRLKLNPLREVIGGKRLVVVDDSIVRGNTQRALVRMLREAGARRSTCGSRRRRCSGPASTASTSPPAPNSSPRARRRRRPPLDRRRLPRLHQRGRHDRGHQPATLTGCARRASPAPIRSSCRTPRTGSASRCWKCNSRSTSAEEYPEAARPRYGLAS